MLALVVIGLLTYFGFTKQNPFANPYELHAVFDSANRLQERSPVRIAGVNVGKVTKVEPLEDGSGKARVTMEIDETGLPIKEDAELKVRSRLFLEGNYFVDLHPGRPDSTELDSGRHDRPEPDLRAGPVPPGPDGAPVGDAQDLQRLLKEYSGALRGRGARGFNEAIKHWEEAWRTTSQVNDAYLGREPHDLTRVLDGQARVYGALSSNEEALKDLVTGPERHDVRLRPPGGRTCAPRSRSCATCSARAGPRSRRSTTRCREIRAFARDALPGARSSKATLDAQLPFIARRAR